MEHSSVSSRPLTDGEIIEKICLTTTETYFRIARQSPNFQTFADDGIIGSQSSAVHPAARFAFVARPTVASLARLAQRSVQLGGLGVYCLPTDEDQAVFEMLCSSGFKPENRLNLMFHSGSRSQSNLELHWLENPLTRHEHVKTIARQFFPSESSEFIGALSQWTATHPRLKLARWTDKEEWIGGGMLSPVGDCTGLYSIAIEASRRSRGLGAELVRTLLSSNSSPYASLECGDHLVQWYEALGFRKYAKMVYFQGPQS